jgi:hypothetical protein
MPEESERPKFREHLHEIRRALGGLGRDVELDAEQAPHLAKEGTKNALARAAGVRRGAMHEWTDPKSEDTR